MYMGGSKSLALCGLNGILIGQQKSATIHYGDWLIYLSEVIHLTVPHSNAEDTWDDRVAMDHFIASMCRHNIVVNMAV